MGASRNDRMSVIRELDKIPILSVENSPFFAYAGRCIIPLPAARNIWKNMCGIK